MHVQSISAWAAPAIGPYSQCNRMGDILVLAGQIGLYSAKLELVSNSIVTQYLQVKHNFNQVIRETSKSSSLIWQQIAKSAIVYISEDANISELMPHLKKDLAFLPEASILVRVAKLPMNCQVEIEILCELTDKISCKQNLMVPA